MSTLSVAAPRPTRSSSALVAERPILEALRLDVTNAAADPQGDRPGCPAARARLRRASHAVRGLPQGLRAGGVAAPAAGERVPLRRPALRGLESAGDPAPGRPGRAVPDLRRLPRAGALGGPPAPPGDEPGARCARLRRARGHGHRVPGVRPHRWGPPWPLVERTSLSERKGFMVVKAAAPAPGLPYLAWPRQRLALRQYGERELCV